MSSKLRITVVIPIFNEEENILLLADELAKSLSEFDHRLLFVDDGSTDKSLSIIKEICGGNETINYLSFSRNFGHQAALKAGLDHSAGDLVIMMDGDMEHPPQLIPKMIQQWQDGSDIVITHRLSSARQTFFKKLTSNLFYKVMNFFSDTAIERGSADFRLLDAKVVEVLKEFPEQPLFYRALVNWLGFKRTTIDYSAQLRHAGKSKYTKRRMIDLSIEGITSFSIKPLRLSSIIGGVLSMLSILYGCYAIYVHVFTDQTVTGWTSLMVLISFIGGVQMIMIGVLGEYIGKLFMASKKRPSYIVEEKKLANLL